MLVVFIVVAVALEEEHMACLDQQHFGREGHVVVVVVVVVMEDFPISDLDDSSNLDSQ